jgi:hypothetical protein
MLKFPGSGMVGIITIRNAPSRSIHSFDESDSNHSRYHKDNRLRRCWQEKELDERRGKRLEMQSIAVRADQVGRNCDQQRGEPILVNSRSAQALDNRARWYLAGPIGSSRAVDSQQHSVPEKFSCKWVQVHRDRGKQTCTRGDRCRR